MISPVCVPFVVNLDEVLDFMHHLPQGCLSLLPCQ